MEPLDLFDAAAAEFRSRLAVPDDAWGRPTPCEGWDVRALVAHVLGGNRMSSALLGGASADAAAALVRGAGVPDPTAVLGDYDATVDELRAAFAEDGALSRTCHHPMGDIDGARLLGFRVTDLTLHAWDLARAVGGDEALDPVLVGAVWDVMAPMAGFIGQVGVFGSGPTGEVDDGRPLQDRLLDLAGRRP